MYYVGLDVHKRYCTATVMDEQKEIIDQTRIGSMPDELRSYFRRFDEPMSVVMEACYNWGYFADILEGMVEKVVLAHPLKTKAIAEARIKTDKIDSKVLAELLRSDMVAEAYIPSKETRLVKNFLRYRAGLTAISTMIKNKIHALVDQHAHPARETLEQLSDAFGKAGMEILERLELPGYDTQILRSWLGTLRHLHQEIVDANRWVRQHVREDELASLLKTIPGIGDQFALLIRYEIDRIDRFVNPKKLVSYAGLAPATYQSGGKTRHGSITKQGNKWLRWALVEASQKAPIKSPYFKRYFNRLKKKGGNNQARVATARKLAEVIFGVLKTRTPYRESLIGQPPSKGSSRSAV